MSTKTTDGQGEDSWENAGLEEEHDSQHGETSLAVNTHGSAEEDHDHGHEDHENPSRLDEHEETGGGESTDGEKSLSNGVSIRGGGRGDSGGFLGVFDELGGDCDLSTDVTELSGNTEEELVLLAEGLLDVTGQVRALLGLESHIGISDFWDWREEEDDGEEGDESGDTDVCPLYLAEIVTGGLLEEDTRGEERSNNRSDGLEGLGKLETELGKSGRTTGGDERVGGCLEGGKTAADDEEGAAEAAERLVDSGRPEHEGTNGVDQKTQDEGPSVAELPDEPSGVCEGTNEVSSKV